MRKTENESSDVYTAPAAARVRLVLERERRDSRSMAIFLSAVIKLMGNKTEDNSPFVRNIIVRDIPPSVKYVILANGVMTLAEIVTAADRVVQEFTRFNDTSVNMVDILRTLWAHDQSPVAN